jgi:hypothetical protein
MFANDPRLSRTRAHRDDKEVSTIARSARDDRALVSTNQRKRNIGQNGIIANHNEKTSIAPLSLSVSRDAVCGSHVRVSQTP